MTEKKPKISLIIPAHNEAENISRVLKIAVQAKKIDEILVVADACQDQTAEIAKKFPVTVIERKKSQGKGSAMIAGVARASGKIIAFADADLKNLTINHLNQILEPVIKGRATMSVGLRDRVFGLGALIPKFFPMFAIGGERAMTREFFENLPKTEIVLDFGIETVMNYWAKKKKLKIARPVLKNLQQIVKEKKWGWWPGFLARIKLTKQVWRARKIMKERQ